MKMSFWALFMVTLGIIGIAVVSAFQDINTTNEHNYYQLKEVTEAALLDSIDLGHYRITGEIRIVKEEFVENFVRRFSESFSRTKTYNIRFYDIIENPPKVSVAVIVDENVQIYNYEPVDFDIINSIDAILETKYY